MADGTRGAGGGGDNSEFITLQDASREFNVYPSTVRAWQREGLIAPEHLVNIRVQRGALIRAIEEANKPSEVREPIKGLSPGEIALARRILEICTSDTDKAAKLTVIESIAQSILNRLPGKP